MAKGDYYFPLYYRKLLSSTIGWKDDEFGAYLRLLIYQFDNGSIPNDLEELKKIAPSLTKNWKKIAAKFKKTRKGNLINPVMDEIYKKVQKKKKINKISGSKGGRPKKEKTERLPDEKPNGFENKTETKPILRINNQESIINKKNDDSKIAIEKCLELCFDDPRWINFNNVTSEDLLKFNAHLEEKGTYEKSITDYKIHFINWRKKILREEESSQGKTMVH